jgi:hypothetical protein
MSALETEAGPILLPLIEGKKLGRVHTNYGIIGVNGDHCGAVRKDQG